MVPAGLLFYYLPGDRLSRLRHKRFPTFSFILDLFYFILLLLPSLYWRQAQTTQSIHTIWICIVLAIFHVYLNNGSHKNRIDAKFEWLDDIFKIKLMETSVINVCGCLFCLQIIEDASPVSCICLLWCEKWERWYGKETKCRLFFSSKIKSERKKLLWL